MELFALALLRYFLALNFALQDFSRTLTFCARTFAPLDLRAHALALLDFCAVISRSCYISNTARTGQPGQDSQNRSARTGQPEEDRQKVTGRRGQAEEDRQKRTGRRGQAEEDRQNRTGRT